MSNSAPLLLIVSSPSGAGKSTLTRRLLASIPNTRFSVSHTTRQPRAGEQDGREYHFVSRETFEHLIKQGEFLEWAPVHQNLYGTSRMELERASDARGLVFDVDHQGARQIKAAVPDAIAIFILPPSMQVLEQRLRGRASETEAAFRVRFDAAKNEIAHYGLFDYVLVNDQLEEATANLESIFRAEECRRKRAAKLAEELLASGRGFESAG
jgi:guanylate kinase